MPENRPDLFEPAIAVLDDNLSRLDQRITEAARQARQPPDLTCVIEAVWESLDTVSGLLGEHCLKDHSYVGNAASLYSRLSALRAAIGGLDQLRVGRAWSSFAATAVIVTGTSGAGKTHLLCDLARRRAAKDLPTIIALGEHFGPGPVEADLGRLIDFQGSSRQLLATFDVACQTSGEFGLIIIDGLNETADRRLWRNYLNGFLDEVAKYRHIRLVLSCRTEFLSDTLSQGVLKKLPSFQHGGFDEIPREALHQFVDWYGIERPSFPVLDPETTNPLFLKLLCTALQARGERRFPRTGVGTTWIYDNFLDTMNERLSGEDRCDYDSSDALVQQAVEKIADAMRGVGRRLPKARVAGITTALLNRSWSQSLLNGLLKEAILTDFPVDGTDYIRFGYERLGDIALAKLIVAAGLEAAKVEVSRLAERWWAHAGVLQALSAIFPETYGVELVDLMKISRDGHHFDAFTDFLLSVAWRKPDAVSARTMEILAGLQHDPTFTDQANNAILQLATVPGHPLNADWLHGQLAGLTLTERDATWSYFCDRQEEIDGHLPRLISWAWSAASVEADDQTRRLAALALCWALSCSHRPTRDNATKAIIALLERAPHLYQPILHSFADGDDDYIEERLLAVGCGIAQRALTPDTAIGVAEAVLNFTFGRDYWPQNYLSRDYARRAIDAALEHGWQPDIDNLSTRIRPPYNSDWIAPQRTQAEIKELAGPPNHRYSAIHHLAMSGYDDFRKYVVNSAVRSFKLDRDFTADHFGAILFEQALGLGWTPERFGAMDRYLPGPHSPDGKKREGYAQKYIWVAFKQLVGRMTDRYELDPKHRDDQHTQYETPLDVYGHDIDPTVLQRRTENRVYADTPVTWYAPVGAKFPDLLDPNWATNDEHSPPVDRLLICTDDAGARWMLLEGHYQWSQPRYPETAAARTPHHTVWAQIRSYLIDAADADAWERWATGQDFDGRWMPESGSPTGLLLADHPYKADWPNLDRHDGSRCGHNTLPGSLAVTTTRYGGVTDWDQSDSKHLYTFLPSTTFCSALHLKRAGEFRWGTASAVVAGSFAAHGEGPDTVHITVEALSQALAVNRQCLLWTVLAAKETTALDSHERPAEGEPLARSYSASYLFDGTSVQRLDATARTMRAGGVTSPQNPWHLPSELPL